MDLRSLLPAAGDAGGTLLRGSQLPPSGRLGVQGSSLLPARSLMETAGPHAPTSGPLYPTGVLLWRPASRPRCNHWSSRRREGARVALHCLCQHPRGRYQLLGPGSSPCKLRPSGPIFSEGPPLRLRALMFFEDAQSWEVAGLVGGQLRPLTTMAHPPGALLIPVGQGGGSRDNWAGTARLRALGLVRAERAARASRGCLSPAGPCPHLVSGRW